MHEQKKAREGRKENKKINFLFLFSFRSPFPEIDNISLCDQKKSTE